MNINITQDVEQANYISILRPFGLKTYAFNLAITYLALVLASLTHTSGSRNDNPSTR